VAEKARALSGTQQLLMSQSVQLTAVHHHHHHHHHSTGSSMLVMSASQPAPSTSGTASWKQNEGVLPTSDDHIRQE
jgi:hypothetical protein